MTEGLSGGSIHRRCTGKSSLIADPQSTVLLPRKIPQEVIFRINVVAKGTRAKEGVHEAAIGELTQDLDQTYI